MEESINRVELPQETDNYIRESIDHALGLPVSRQTLLHKLRAIEAEKFRLGDRCLALQSRLKEKDVVIERSRAEASMNALALKKFVEENQRLAAQCSDLLESCGKLETECALYDRDREALMDFANEVDEKAKEAEFRIAQLEEENSKLAEEMNKLADQNKRLKSDELLRMVDASSDDLQAEKLLLNSMLNTVFSQSETTTKVAHGFLEAHSGEEACAKLLKMWSSLSPSTHKIIALAAEVTKLEKDKQVLATNLHLAEEEVSILFEENQKLQKENKKFTIGSSGGKHTSSGSRKGKRKSSSRMISPVKEKKLDFADDADSALHRQPLSPLRPSSFT